MQIRYKRVEAVLKQREQLRALTECVEATKECLEGAVGELLKHGESIETLDAKRGKLSKESQELYKMFN
jgi:predicted component of type VI protein secretion system